MAARENLIQNLASSFGMPDLSTTQYSTSRYDKATGTLYCNGMAISKTTIEKAKSHYQNQMLFYKNKFDKGEDVLNMMMVATVAYNAICLLGESIEKKDS